MSKKLSIVPLSGNNPFEGAGLHAFCKRVDGSSPILADWRFYRRDDLLIIKKEGKKQKRGCYVGFDTHSSLVGQEKESPLGIINDPSFFDKKEVKKSTIYVRASENLKTSSYFINSLKWVVLAPTSQGIEARVCSNAIKDFGIDSLSALCDTEKTEQPIIQMPEQIATQKTEGMGKFYDVAIPGYSITSRMKLLEEKDGRYTFGKLSGENQIFLCECGRDEVIFNGNSAVVDCKEYRPKITLLQSGKTKNNKIVFSDLASKISS